MQKYSHGLCCVWWNDSAEFHDVTESCSLSDRDATTFKVSGLYSFAWWWSVFWIWLHYVNCRLLYTQYITKQWHCKVLHVYSNISSVKCKLDCRTNIQIFGYPNLKTLLNNKECALSFIIRLSSETLDSMLEVCMILYNAMIVCMILYNAEAKCMKLKSLKG